MVSLSVKTNLPYPESCTEAKYANPATTNDATTHIESLSLHITLDGYSFHNLLSFVIHSVILFQSGYSKNPNCKRRQFYHLQCT